MKIIILISALLLIFQTSFAQKQYSESKLFTEINIPIYTATDNSSINELNLVSKFEQKDRISSKTQICKSESIDIARNSGGKNAEGRLRTAYSAGLSKPLILKPATLINRNSNGKHGDWIFPVTYSKDFSKSRTNLIVDDIARNCSGRNSN